MALPEVEAILKEKDIQSVVLFGIEVGNEEVLRGPVRKADSPPRSQSHICVVQTALSLLASGKDVHVLADGVSSINAEEVPVALARMRQAGAQITTSESLLYELMGEPSLVLTLTHDSVVLSTLR